MLAFAWLLGLSLTANRGSIESQNEFRSYLTKPDTTYSYSITRSSMEDTIDLTSQTWQGKPWTHKLIVRESKSPIKKGLCVLLITGNGPRPGDRLLMDAVAGAVNLPTSFLFSIPNQPLYGFSEDNLIAYTFDKYLETKDPSWPLLFPMTKSVLRAMDAIQDATKNSDNPIKQFIITGASKRGWTTWLTGAAGDSRVKAIAPMVIDNLNLGKQMKHQLELWGKYSEQIIAYTNRGLQAKFVSPEGRHLGDIVDPYTYRSSIRVPTLIITGANDPYWAADACRQYYDDLKQPKWLVTVPNVGHNLGGGAEAIETLGAFCHSVAGAYPMPKESWDVRLVNKDTVRISLNFGRGKLLKLTAWSAVREDFDFKQARYENVAAAEPTNPNSGRVEVYVKLPTSGNLSVFGEATYMGTKSFRLCCPTTIFRHQTPASQ